MQTKPIYTMSATLFNSLKWLKGRTTQEQRAQALEQFTNTVNKIYVDNIYTLRGKEFEAKIMNSEQNDFNVNVHEMEQQKWFNKYIEYEDFIIKLVGKMDLYDKENKVIYDIKRTTRYFEGKYSDKNTIQHDIYLYANPEVEEFYYLVAAGENDNDLEYIKVLVKRKENLDEYIKEHIEDLIIEMHKLDLLEVYFKTHKVNW